MQLHTSWLFCTLTLCSDAASRWAGWPLAHLEFGSSVNPITTRGADYAHNITASPPRFENPVASLRVWYMPKWSYFEIQKAVKGLNLFSCFSPQQSVKGYDPHWQMCRFSKITLGIVSRIIVKSQTIAASVNVSKYSIWALFLGR